MEASGGTPLPSTPAEAPRTRQKRRPHRSGGRGSDHRSDHRHHRHLQRKVSFDPVATKQRSAAAGSAIANTAPALSRHASFDPRLGARPHGSRERGAANAGSDHQAAWAKLVARAQNLEEALASERASKRLLAARAATEKADLHAKLARVKEERDSFEHLWRDGKLQLQQHMSEWESERTALYQELARLRRALANAGLDALPPSRPPGNLAVALRDDDAGEPGIDDVAPTGGAAGAQSTARQQEADSSERIGGKAATQAGAGARTVAGAPPLAPPPPPPPALGGADRRRASRSASSSSKDAMLERLSRQASKLDGQLSSAALAAQVVALGDGPPLAAASPSAERV